MSLRFVARGPRVVLLRNRHSMSMGFESPAVHGLETLTELKKYDTLIPTIPGYQRKQSPELTSGFCVWNGRGLTERPFSRMVAVDQPRGQFRPLSAVKRGLTSAKVRACLYGAGVQA